MKVAILFAVRFVAVTILYFVTFIVVSGALLATAAPPPAADDAGAALLAMLVVSLVSAAVWSYVIVRMMKGEWWETRLAVALVLRGILFQRANA